MQGLKPILRSMAVVLPAMCLVSGWAPAAMAAAEMGHYLSGGIGLDGRSEMHAQRKDYNLRLGFAQARSGEYLGGVKLSLQRGNDAPTTYDDVGPLFYIQVQPGHYRITADYEGRQRTLALTVGAKGVERVLYWP